ncbi:MAG TPA: carboxypeptidase regulatory-like domain-containing protein, partial [Pyrinomonadaceae bacterium]|nr:carboxypeptidase regulatory-like domain-containing protein [Pyrinomonadaceae bacterium]
MRHFFCSVMLLIAALAVSPVASHAQANASLAGTVTDQNKAVVSGATVRTLNLASGREVAATTDAEGRYEIAGLPPGVYRVSVGVEGFQTVSQSINLQNAGVVTRDFRLTPGVISETITVTAGKGSARLTVETPQSVTTIDESSIEELRPASTLQAIERTPNLTQVGANPVGARPRLRGLTSNRLLLIVDGDRLNNVRSDPLSGVSPGVVDVTELQSAEVLSGAGSSLYGSDALAGTINLVTKSPVAVDSGKYLGLRFDGDARTNGLLRRGGATLNLSNSRLALRVSGADFRQGSYHAGGESIPLAEVVRFGTFLTDLGNAAGNNVARTYAVWDLPAGAEIPNGQAHGFNTQADAWLFLPHFQSLRYRQLNSQHKDIGFSFNVPPFEPRDQFNTFRRLDKYGLRYEASELAKWLPRVSAGFYRQKYAFTDANLVSTINAGSSWQVLTPSNAAALTGARSTFAPGIFTDGKNSVTSLGVDAQATLIPRAGAVITTGINYLRDYSKDQFLR